MSLFHDHYTFLASERKNQEFNLVSTEFDPGVRVFISLVKNVAFSIV